MLSLVDVALIKVETSNILLNFLSLIEKITSSTFNITYKLDFLFEPHSFVLE